MDNEDNFIDTQLTGKRKCEVSLIVPLNLKDLEIPE